MQPQYPQYADPNGGYGWSPPAPQYPESTCPFAIGGGQQAEQEQPQRASGKRIEWLSTFAKAALPVLMERASRPRITQVVPAAQSSRDSERAERMRRLRRMEERRRHAEMDAQRARKDRLQKLQLAGEREQHRKRMLTYEQQLQQKVAMLQKQEREFKERAEAESKSRALLVLKEQELMRDRGLIASQLKEIERTRMQTKQDDPVQSRQSKADGQTGGTVPHSPTSLTYNIYHEGKSSPMKESVTVEETFMQSAQPLPLCSQLVSSFGRSSVPCRNA